MKKLFIFLIALLLPFFALEMSADEEKAIITIPIELGPEKNLQEVKVRNIGEVTLTKVMTRLKKSVKLLYK